VLSAMHRRYREAISRRDPGLTRIAGQHCADTYAYGQSHPSRRAVVLKWMRRACSDYASSVNACAQATNDRFGRLTAARCGGEYAHGEGGAAYLASAADPWASEHQASPRPAWDKEPVPTVEQREAIDGHSSPVASAAGQPTAAVAPPWGPLAAEQYSPEREATPQDDELPKAGAAESTEAAAPLAVAESASTVPETTPPSEGSSSEHRPTTSPTSEKPKVQRTRGTHPALPTPRTSDAPDDELRTIRQRAWQLLRAGEQLENYRLSNSASALTTCSQRMHPLVEQVKALRRAVDRYPSATPGTPQLRMALMGLEFCVLCASGMQPSAMEHCRSARRDLAQ